MKPSEMSNEELAEGIELEVSERPKSIAHLVSDDYYLEAAARLRNSIPKHKVEIVEKALGTYSVMLNGIGVYLNAPPFACEQFVKRLEAALGINDTEVGGDGH